MPKGCDNPKSAMNNGPTCDPWNWNSYDAYHAGESCAWKSKKHLLRVRYTLGYYVIVTERGQYSLGPNGRLRRFKTLGAAMIAANVMAKI